MSLSEEQLFQIKQKFLQHIPHPKLIVKQINRLNLDKDDDSNVTDNAVNMNMDLKEFLNLYTNQLLALKLQIANAKNATELHQKLSVLLDLHNSLINKLAAYIPNLDFDDKSVKQSDPFDSYAIGKEIEELNVKENEIKDYLCSQFLNRKAADYTILAEAVIRANKILNHAR